MKKFIYLTLALGAMTFSLASCNDEATTPTPEVIAFTERQLDVTPGYALPAEAEAVDLGLSVKWANMNVGQSATSFGDKFAWGEIAPKASYTWDNYEFCVQPYPVTLNRYVFGDFQKYNDGTKPGDTLNKNDDAAYVMWGGDWRMPTDAEFAELYSLDITINYVKKIVRFTAKNGNYIDFLSSDKKTAFWTSTLDYDTMAAKAVPSMAFSPNMIIADYDPSKAHTYKDEFIKVNPIESLYIYNTTFHSTDYRSQGLYVRPVRK